MNKKIIVIAGNSNPDLFKSVEKYISQQKNWEEFRLVNCDIGRFSDGEPNIYIDDNIRGRIVYILQSTCAPLGENLLELCTIIDACDRGSALSIRPVLPYFGLARQDRKVKARVPISASWAANVIINSASPGIVRGIITVDIHSGQTQGSIKGPFDNLFARPTLIEFIRKNYNFDYVVVSPDAGGTERAQKYAAILNVPLAVIEKRRDKDGRLQEEEMRLIQGEEEINGKNAFIIDDMIDTAGTLTQGASLLKAKGAERIIAVCTHPVFSGPAIKRLNESYIDEIIVTDTIPLRENAKLCKKIQVVSLASLIGEVIIRTFEDLSVSELFKIKE